jgi:hypothetical protein
MSSFCSDQGRTRVCGEGYVCTPQPENRGDAEQDKKGHLWMDTNYLRF